MPAHPPPRPRSAQGSKVALPPPRGSRAGALRGHHALKREAVILAAARAFRAARLPQHLARRPGRASLKVTKPTLYLVCAEQGSHPVRVLPGGPRARSRPRSTECEKATGPARERLFAFIRGYAAAIVGDFGWCMLRAEDQHLGAAMGRKIKLAQGRHRPAHARAHRGRSGRTAPSASCDHAHDRARARPARSTGWATGTATTRPLNPAGNCRPIHRSCSTAASVAAIDGDRGAFARTNEQRTRS